MKKSIHILLLTAIAALTVPFVAGKAQAVNKGIQISPVTYNFEIKEGESKKAKIIVKNNDVTDLNFVCETENFAKVTDNGAPSFNGIPKPDGLTTLADWFSYNSAKEGTLKPGEAKQVDFTISVPVGAEPGGHYAAIFAKAINKTPEGKTELGISSRVGTLILVSVPGVTSKTAEITNFDSPKFLWKGPVPFSMTVKNTGTIHYDSRSNIEIKPILGKISNVTIGTHTIIPKNSRIFDGKWAKRFPFGYYTITASATNGDGQLVTTSATMWAIPLEIVIPALVLLLIIILIVKYVKKHLRFVE